MDTIDSLLLARIQFGFTMSFHIVFPAITIGLSSYLAVLQALGLRTGQQIYRDLFHFWLKVFAVAFGMGVVSGLVMAYQFGTNWSAYSMFAGSITGPLLAYEVLTAFFLEAGFLGVMLFGMNRVSDRLHLLSTCAVAAGTLISATWIIASNSWMQTPDGYQIIDGRVVPVDWWRVIFNPSFPYRLLHMVLAAYLATALMVGASGAWHLLRGNDTPAVRKMLSMAMWMVLFTAPAQALVGDQHGLNTLEHQPAKLAAIEGHWESSGEPVPLVVFGLPSQREERNRYAIEVPMLGSLILTHSRDGQIPALKDFAPEDRPPVAAVFWAFRVMVGLGVLMILLGLWSLWQRWRGHLYGSRPFLRFAVLMGPAGLIAILAGWYTAELGRQPWVVHGLMRTRDGVSEHSIAQLAISLGVLVAVYAIVFGAGARYGLRIIAAGPTTGEGRQPDEGGPGTHKQQMRPLSAAPADDPPKDDGAR